MRTFLLPLLLISLGVQAQYAGGDGRGDVQLSFGPVLCDAPEIGSITNSGPSCGVFLQNMSVTATGTEPLTYSWSGSFLLGATDLADAQAVITDPGAYDYVVVVSNACGTAGATTTVVFANAPQGGFTYNFPNGGPASLCTDQGPLAPVQIVPLTPGGTYAASPAGLVVDPLTGVVDAANSAVGGYSVTYTIPAGTCPVFNTSASLSMAEPVTRYADQDGDGEGDPNTFQTGCEPPDVGVWVLSNLDDCPIDPDKIAPGLCGCNQQEPGAVCDDGLSTTVNDVVGTDCVCRGELTTAVPAQSASSTALRYDRALGIITLQQAGTGPVFLLDATGRILLSAKGKAVQFDVSDLPAAVYIIRADDFVQRVVVEA